MDEEEISLEQGLRDSMLESIRSLGPIMEDGRSFLTEKQYPEINDFKVSVFPNESKHPGRPHCQVRIDSKTATFDINDGSVLAGDVGRWERTVREVLLGHKDGLLAFWDETRPDDQRLQSH
tara:strand:+ start:1847 stop:2209 length:363 start_codon:yes stop_codon:yes gene_type:complete